MRSWLARRIALFGLAIVAFCAMFDFDSFWGAMQQTADVVVGAPMKAIVEWRDSRPPSALPVRAQDFERYPRRGFGFVLEIEEIGFRLDTFAGTATKDLVMRFAPGM